LESIRISPVWVKCFGGGFPLALIGGKEKILDCLAASWRGVSSRDPFRQFRCSGERACRLNAVEREGFYQELERNQSSHRAHPQGNCRKENQCLHTTFGSMVSLFFGMKEVRQRRSQ